MPKEINDGKILLIDGGLEFRAMTTDVKLNVTSAGVFNSFREKELKMLQKTGGQD